ncbi:MAG: hypothetical protein ACRD0E_11280, partial [Acidimicrobiales bacterium]
MAIELVTHPLDTLRADEIQAAVAIVSADPRLGPDARFASVTLEDPSRQAIAEHRETDPVERRVRLVVVPGPDSTVIEVTVALPAGSITTWQEQHGVRPALLIEECMGAIEAVRADPEWRRAMGRRGITDFDKIQIDPWPTGNFSLAIE